MSVPEAPSAEREIPSDTARGAARSHRLVLGILSSFASRGLAALAPLAMIPVVLPTLGAPTYGAWMTIVSITSMLIWADLGLGNGLLTRLSQHIAKSDYLSARRDILATYLMVGSLGGFLSLLTICSPLFISWPKILNATGGSAQSAAAIAVVCLVCFFINMPLSLIQRVQYAAQQVVISNLFTSLGPIVSFALTLFAAGRMPVPMVVGAATIGPLVANVSATAWFFNRNRDLIPGFNDSRGGDPLALLSLGGLFVLISTLSSLAINSDSLIIAHSLGASRVAEYAVAARVMGSMGLLITLVSLPLWPATANALARGDIDWVRRTTRRMTILSGGFVALSSAVILAISGPLVASLSQGLVERDLALVVSLGAWWTIVGLTSPIMMVQNASGVLRPQLVGWLLYLAVSLPLKVIAIPSLGLWGGPLVGAVAYCLFVVPAALWGYGRSMGLATEEATGQSGGFVEESLHLDAG